MIKFANPYMLFLLVIPFGFLILFHIKSFLRPAAMVFSDLTLFPKQKPTWRYYLHRLKPWIITAAMVLAIVASARPQTSFGHRKVFSEGIDIMLILDTSGSMRAEDFRPYNRLAVAKEVIKKFIAGRQGDRIGLVVFSRQAFTQCPLTVDYNLLTQFLGMVDFGMVEDGTAIGLALATAANRLVESPSKSKVMILLTDGANNAGEIDPITAAKAISALGIKVYTIGAGREGMVDMPVVDPIFGKRYVKIQSDIDEKLLQNVADITGGQFFRARDEKALDRIYEQISQLEKSKVEIKEYYEYEEHYAGFLAASIALFCIEFMIATVFARSIP